MMRRNKSAILIEILLRSHFPLTFVRGLRHAATYSRVSRATDNRPVCRRRHGPNRMERSRVATVAPLRPVHHARPLRPSSFGLRGGARVLGNRLLRCKTTIGVRLDLSIAAQPRNVRATGREFDSDPDL